MANISKRKQFEASGKFHAGIEKTTKEEQEYPHAKKGIFACKICDAVYYSKSWHHKREAFQKLNSLKDVDMKFFVCPACQMLNDGTFEGEIIIENSPQDSQGDVLRNIKNTGQKEYERDPMDRILKIEERPGHIRVLTSENQLARNIARQIERAYKKRARLKILLSKEDDLIRIVIRFS
ncbi:MAG: hypothetical protein HYS15_00370 [Candidatus Spechtbacteria bacterium]|nr:hypothetical protein [Candidatus Spechtbacteria bacterium]